MQICKKLLIGRDLMVLEAFLFVRTQGIGKKLFLFVGLLSHKYGSLCKHLCSSTTIGPIRSISLSWAVGGSTTCGSSFMSVQLKVCMIHFKDEEEGWKSHENYNRIPAPSVHRLLIINSQKYTASSEIFTKCQFYWIFPSGQNCSSNVGLSNGQYRDIICITQKWIIHELCTECT